MRTRALVLSLAGVLALLPLRPAAQQIMPRIIVPPPPSGGIHSSSRVMATLDGAILQVRCEQVFTNEGPRAEEVQVLLPIPAQAVVSDGLLLADGREYPAEVLGAAEARRIYEDIVRARRDPALLELVGHGLIRLSAFPIPPGGTRTVSYRYHQTIAVQDGRIRLRFPIASLTGIDRRGPLDLSLDIDGREPLAQVYSPSHSLQIERHGARTAHVHYAADGTDPHDVIEVDARRDGRPIGVDLRTAPGHGGDDYFLLAISPAWELLEARNRAPETVVFALDTSGSMSGEKFEQARQSLRRLLNDLRPADRFNLIAFASDVRPLFRDGPRHANDAALACARDWIDGLSAEGGTAIAEALDRAARVEDEATLILFLTDGRPTVGATGHAELLARAAHAARGARFYALGVGYDVDAVLLDDLAKQGEGTAVYVRPGENVEDAVTTLHQRVGRPAARDVRLRIRGARVHEVFPEGAHDLFAGEPLLYAGRVGGDAGPAVVEIEAEAPDGTSLEGRWRVDFGDPDAYSTAVPVLWASRKAASLLDRIRRNGRDPATVTELRELSRQYGILNEEVALLARDDERVASTDIIIGGVDARRSPSLQSPETSSLKSFPVESFREAISANPGVVTQDGQLHARGGRSGSIAYAPPADVAIAATQATLRDVKSKADMPSNSTATVRLVGGITFRKDGDAWVDERLDNTPRNVETIRIRAYGSAYFQLARSGGRIAEWLALGETVRVLLPGIVLEVVPDGRDALPSSVLARIREAAARG